LKTALHPSFFPMREAPATSGSPVRTALHVLHRAVLPAQPPSHCPTAGRTPPPPHFNGKLLVELHPAPSEEVLVSREKASAVKAWLEG
jgi:hypothetical protein